MGQREGTQNDELRRTWRSDDLELQLSQRWLLKLSFLGRNAVLSTRPAKNAQLTKGERVTYVNYEKRALSPWTRTG